MSRAFAVFIYCTINECKDEIIKKRDENVVDKLKRKIFVFVFIFLFLFCSCGSWHNTTSEIRPQSSSDLVSSENLSSESSSSAPFSAIKAKLDGDKLLLPHANEVMDVPVTGIEAGGHR